MLLSILNSCSPFHEAFAAPPEFDQVLIYDKNISNQNNDWVQTYGNDSANLRSDPADLLAVDYFSDGKTLDITFWVKSNSENASVYVINLSKRLGMVCLLPLFPCLKIQDITEPISTIMLNQLMENGVNIFTSYHQQVLLRL